MRAADLNILALDTVTEACSAALHLRGEIRQEFAVTANAHSQRALGMAQDLLRAAGLELRDLDALAVDIGPGSFTGARIGIGVAQGLAYGAGLPVIAVNSLEALADGVAEEIARGAGQGAGAMVTVLPAIDARMAQIYFALYACGGDAPDEIIAPTLSAPGEVGEIARGRANCAGIVGAGSGWERYAPALSAAVGAAVSEWLPGRHPQAAAVGRIAAARGLQHAVSPLHLRANYLRNQVAKPAGKPVGNKGGALTNS